MVVWLNEYVWGIRKRVDGVNGGDMFFLLILGYNCIFFFKSLVSNLREVVRNVFRVFFYNERFYIYIFFKFVMDLELYCGYNIVRGGIFYRI